MAAALQDQQAKPKQRFSLLNFLRRQNKNPDKTGEKTAITSAKRHSNTETDVTMETVETTPTEEHSELMMQIIHDETAMLTKQSTREQEEKLVPDIHHFRKLHVLRKPNYSFIIFKGTIASLCIALNTMHFLSVIGVFPPTFSFFKLKATNYDHATKLATNNINKLLKDRVGLVVRWVPYSTIPANETYSNCKVLINNYQWSQWTEFEKKADQHCGIKIFTRYYNLRIMKLVQTTIATDTPLINCPGTVQYKHMWERACCPKSDLEPLENYLNLSYDNAFCYVKSSLRFVNAGELSTICKTGHLWSPLPVVNSSVNATSYHRNDFVKNLEIQHGTALNSYWINVKRIDGNKWLMNNKLVTFNSRLNCKNHCYDMKILLSPEAYKKYTSKKKHFVCVRNEKWELFSIDDSQKCLAICITRTGNN